MIRIPKISLFAAIVVALIMSGCRSHKSSFATKYKPAYNKVVYSFPMSDEEATGRLLGEAKMWLGVPYRYGGNDREGVDCSGLVVQLYKRALGLSLPRVSREQADYCSAVSFDRLIPGDLLFFATGKDPQRISHVGMFLGGGKMIHASTKNGVVVADVDRGYFAEHFRKAGQVAQYHAMLTGKQGKRKKKSESTPVTVDDVYTSAPAKSPIVEKEVPRKRKGQLPKSVDDPSAPTPEVVSTVVEPTVVSQTPAPVEPAAPAKPEKKKNNMTSEPVKSVKPSSRPSQPETNPDDARASVLSRLKLE